LRHDARADDGRQKTCAAAALASGRLCCLHRRAIHAANLSKPLPQTELVEASDLQCCEGANALKEHSVRIHEGNGGLSRGALGFCWIGNAPMRRYRLAGPDRTRFARRRGGAPGLANSSCMTQ
jgi:hypothetical protein